MSIKKVSKSKWQADWREDGKRKRKRFSTKTSAERFLAKIKLFENNGITSTRNDNFKNMTFKELANKYLNEHLVHTRSWNNRNYITTLISKFGSYKLYRITPEIVKPWFYKCFNQPLKHKQLSVATVLIVLRYFKRIFNWGIEMMLIDNNPIQKVSFKKEAKRVNKRNVIITDDEYSVICEALPLYARRIFVCAWESGMRQGEILALKWQHVDLISRLIKLPANSTKEADNKTIGIEQGLYDILIELQTEFSVLKQNQNVFLLNEKPIVNNTIQQVFRRTIKTLNIRHITFHDTRHAYVTRKRRQGFERSVIKKQTGHHTDSMFDWYNNVDEYEIQTMAGYSTSETFELEKMIEPIIDNAQDYNIELGKLQEIVGRIWNEKKQIQK